MEILLIDIKSKNEIKFNILWQSSMFKPIRCRMIIHDVMYLLQDLFHIMRLIPSSAIIHFPTSYIYIINCHHHSTALMNRLLIKKKLTAVV